MQKLLERRLAGAGLLPVFCALCLMACQDLIGLSPGDPKPGDGSGGEGGTTTGGASTSGGSGGGGACSADCVDTECQAAVCDNGICIMTPKPMGILSDTTKGGCRADICDGEGNEVAGGPADADFDDGNDCTWDACAGGIAGHLRKRDGTKCSIGVCESGVCVAATCDVNGVKDGKETDKDCGGPCSDTCLPGLGCNVASDCSTGYCDGSVCKERLAVAAVNLDDSQTFLSLAGGMPWVVTQDMGVFSNLGNAGVFFDIDGSAMAVFQSGSLARWARFSNAGWGQSATWILPVGATQTGWIPAFAQTDAALFVFAQTSNAEHLFIDATSPPNAAFAPIDLDPDPADVIPASGGFSGAAASRQGHPSFFYADGTERLAETRFLVHYEGQAPIWEWSLPQTALEGNYSDGSPAATLTALGTLVVAGRRLPNGDHHLDWILFHDDGTSSSGTVTSNPLFTSPKPLQRRLSLAPLGTEGAILAFRDQYGNLDVRVATSDNKGGLTWSQDNEYPPAPAIPGQPAVARGIDGHRAELMWHMKVGNNPSLCHTSLVGDAQWTTIEYAITAPSTSTFGSVAIATP